MSFEPLVSKWGGQLFEYQIIAVDDGSKDGSPSILDNYAKINERLIVFHKENGGPAAARKYGIDHSESDYLAFCDADDYVEPDWLLCLYKYLKEYNADFSMVGAYLNDVGVVTRGDDELCDIEVWTQTEAYEKYIEHKELNGVLWTNLFKRELFDGLLWNFQMRIYEDDNLIWQMLHKVHRIVKIHVAKYHYMYNQYSLSNRKYDKNWHDSTMYMLNMMINDCQDGRMYRYYDLVLQKRYIIYFSESYNCIINNESWDLDMMLFVLRNDYARSMNSIKGLKNKLKFILLIFSPGMLKLLYGIKKANSL